MKLRLGGEITPFETVVPAVWETVRDIRAMVEERLHGATPAVRDAAVMVASELAENVLKYSADSGGASTLSVDVRADKIAIHTANDVASTQSADEVLAMIERIRNSDDATELYAAAIDAKLEQGLNGTTRQGFYRIAAVGEFQLRAWRERRRLFIWAERKLQ
jgi:hypothetical protein